MHVPLTAIFSCRSPVRAGPWTGEPSVMVKRLPWHGQLIVPSETLFSSQPSWVHTMPSTRRSDAVVRPAVYMCRQLELVLTRFAIVWRDKMSRVEDTARKNDVLPGAMREIRDRYRVDF